MKWVIGVDEVGRGPVAGPVAVCACVMSATAYKKTRWRGLTDSKKMTKNARALWYQKALLLEEQGILSFKVAYRSNTIVDKRGIAAAIRECISEALEHFDLDPHECTVLLDGSLKAPLRYSIQKTIVRGDSKEKIISLASVIAKVSRDTKMALLHKKHPHYNWLANKGYGTKSHYRALREQGLSPLHRKSFLTKL